MRRIKDAGPDRPLRTGERVPDPLGFGGRSSMMLMMAVLAVFLWVSGCGLFVKPEGELIPIREKAPEFSLRDQNEEMVSLQGMLDRGPVLLVFYRGHW